MNEKACSLHNSITNILIFFVCWVFVGVSVEGGGGRLLKEDNGEEHKRNDRKSYNPETNRSGSSVSKSRIVLCLFSIVSFASLLVSLASSGSVVGCLAGLINFFKKSTLIQPRSCCRLLAVVLPEVFLFLFNLVVNASKKIA